jgi:hypothetical protein
MRGIYNHDGIISFSDAVRLNKAGFKPPALKYGQIWYDEGGQEWVVGESGNLVFRALSSGAQAEPSDTAGMVFAPAKTLKTRLFFWAYLLYSFIIW